MTDDAGDLVSAALRCVDDGDLMRAEELLYQAVDEDPTNTDALYNLALILFQQGSYDASYDMISRCIEADPARLKAYHLRGRLRHQSGDYQGALWDFDDEIETTPEDIDVILSRAVTLGALRRYDEAIIACRRAIELERTDARALFNRGLLRNDGDPDGAIADFTAAIERDPRNSLALFGRGFALRIKRRKQEALGDFRACLALDAPQLRAQTQTLQTWIGQLERELMVVNIETPLSDLIATHLEQRTRESFERVVVGFRTARVGVNAAGAPKGATGDIVSSKKRPLGLLASRGPHGETVIVACADPPAFARRFGMRFNAETLGESVLRTVMAHPDCEAVQVNSALAEVSFLIPREVIERLLAVKAKKAEERPPSPIPWWQFW